MSVVKNKEFNLYHTVKHDLVLKFNTVSHAVNADVMAESLRALNVSLSSAASFVKSCQCTRLQVVAIKKGSVEVDLSLSVNEVGDNTDSSRAIVDVVMGVNEIFKFLAGKPIVSVEANRSNDDTYMITNSRGEEQSFSRESYMTFVDARTPPLGVLDNIESNDLRSIELLNSQREPIFVLNSIDFGFMSPSVVQIENEEPFEKVETCLVKALVIPIGKPRNAWTFERDGEAFSANILDVEFIGKVERNEMSFNRGDRFKVEMKTIFDVDSTTLQRKAAKRQILSVVEVIGGTHTTQGQLF